MNYHSIESLVRNAGQNLLGKNKDLSITIKPGEANFVTAYDIANQKYLIENILKEVPDASFFGEEDTEYSVKQVSKNGITFIIDPIDGTTNFMFGYKHSNVSVGIAENGIIIAGFVYDPYLDEMYSAYLNKGSFLNGDRLCISDRSIEQGIVGFDFSRYVPEEDELLWKILPELNSRCAALRNLGSSASDMCRIATGANTGFFHTHLQPYDYAAASLIITEAGGIITRINGTPPDLNRPCGVIAGTPTAYKEIAEIVRSHI